MRIPLIGVWSEMPQDIWKWWASFNFHWRTMCMQFGFAKEMVKAIDCWKYIIIEYSMTSFDFGILVLCSGYNCIHLVPSSSTSHHLASHRIASILSRHHIRYGRNDDGRDAICIIKWQSSNFNGICICAPYSPCYSMPCVFNSVHHIIRHRSTSTDRIKWEFSSPSRFIPKTISFMVLYILYILMKWMVMY